MYALDVSLERNYSTHSVSAKFRSLGSVEALLIALITDVRPELSRVSVHEAINANLHELLWDKAVEIVGCEVTLSDY